MKKVKDVNDRDRVFLDFTNGDFKGWDVEAFGDVHIKTEGDNYYIGTDEPYAYNGVQFRKDILGIEVGRPYRFSISMRSGGAVGSRKMMGLQVILNNNTPGAHIGLRIELYDDEVKSGEWQELKGFVLKRMEGGAGQVWINTYGYYAIDIDNVSMSLLPEDRATVTEQDVTPGIEPVTKFLG